MKFFRFMRWRSMSAAIKLMALCGVLGGVPWSVAVADQTKSGAASDQPPVERTEEFSADGQSTSETEASNDAEPVFTLGPMPLLPPPSWTSEDEATLPSQWQGNSTDESNSTDSNPPRLNPLDSATNGPETTGPNENSNAGQPQKTVDSASRQRDVLKPSPQPESVAPAPLTEPTRADVPKSKDLKPVSHRGMTVTLGSGLVLSSPSNATPKQSAPVAEPAFVPAVPAIVIPDVAPEPTLIETADESSRVDSPSATKPATERTVTTPQPLMEQVDVTAKRLPKPDVFEAPESGFSVSSAPPPGFEDLAGAQTTLVDVIYGKRVVTSAMATFDMGMLEFSNPDDVLNAIVNAKDDQALRDALTGPLDANADALCYSEFDMECGRLTPEIAAIIFDETRFQAELFINPDYLETNYLADSMYLPRSDSGTASVHAFSMSANGDSTDQIFNLSANSLVSYRESRIESQYDIDSNHGLSIETLSVKHDARGWEYEAGAFRSRIQSTAFLTEQNLVGARVATSLNTRTDLPFAEATPLFAYLEQRSRVDIFRGDRLLDSQFYAAGNQQLDTSRLPDGAYNVTVRVADDSGQNSESVYFFARSSVLPPKDQPLYFAEIGQLALTRQGVLPKLTDSHWLRAGTAHRLYDNFGVEATVSSIGDATLIESGFVWFQPGLQVQASLLAGDTAGVSLRSLWQFDQFALSADIRRINSEKAVTLDAIDILPGAYTQAYITASLPLFKGRMLARGRLDMRGSRDYKSFGMNYSREVRRFARSTLSFNVDTSFSSDDSIVRLGVDWRWRDQQHDAIVRPRLHYGSDSGSAEALLNARYNTTLHDSDQGVYRASAFVDRAIERSVVGARLSGEDTRGVGEVELQYGFEGEQTGVAYVANARFGLVSSGNQVAFGGRRSNTSSVIIEIDGNAPEAVFEVLIDKQSHGYAHSGARTIIALPPYETYDVRLVSRGKEFVEFEQAPSSVTLYPGNVKTLKFTANRQIVVIGQVVDEEGYVIAHHTFTDLDGFASTDENGWFQIEVTDSSPLTLKRGAASVCTIELPVIEETDNLVVLDELVCRDP